MAVVALISAKGSPGVTTTALACTLTWQRRVILAECDPAGGSLLAGYLQGALEGPRGIGELAVAELRDGRLEQDFWSQLVDLDAPRRERLLLPGVVNPAQAGSVAPLWQRFADFFEQLGRDDPEYDVIVDCGRLHVTGPPWPILRAASVVLLVTAARLPDLSSARSAADAIGRDLREYGVAPGTLRLLTVGDGHGRGEVSRGLQLPVIGHLPDDPRTAQVLSYGGTVRARRPLMRAAAALESPVRALIERRRATLGGAVPRAV
ncbi:MAG TPA: ParA family protein [Catenuloplanes sp.]